MEHDGEDQQYEDSGGDEAADDHYGKGLLSLAANTGAHGGRQQAQAGHHSGHYNAMPDSSQHGIQFPPRANA